MLVLMKGSTVIRREDLAALPPPESMGPRHTPVPHAVLIDRLQQAAERRGLVLKAQKFGVKKEGSRLFGILDFERVGAGGDARLTTDDESGLMIGVRSANDQAFSVSLVVGRRVFVCDNMAFAGDVLVLRRKHTAGFDAEVQCELAMNRVAKVSAEQTIRIDRMKAWPLTDLEARATLFDAFRQGVIPLRRLKSVAQTYFAPEETWTDVRPRTLWGLNNACTRAARGLPPERALQVGTHIGKFFDGLVTLN